MDASVRSLILGTDWWSDCDDAVALRVLCRAHKEGLISLKGIVINACMKYSAASLSAFVKTEGLTVPIALDRRAVGFSGIPSYQKNLAELPHDTNNETAEDPIRLYRRILAQSTDRVDIAEIGFLQALAAFLESPPDDLSPMTGRELVLSKVGTLWIMGGKYDEPVGAEHNFNLNETARSGAEKVLRLWPRPVVLLGFEVGYSVISGGKLPADDVLTGVLKDHGHPQGRSSWDPMLALLAVCGDPALAGYDTVRGNVQVSAISGENFFQTDGKGLHSYVVKKYPDDYYAEWIDRIIGNGCVKDVFLAEDT